MRNLYGAFLRKEFFIDTSYRLAFCSRWLGVVLKIFMFYYLAQLMGAKAQGYLAEYGVEYFSFVLIGLAALSYFDALIGGYAATVSREGWTGTFEVLLTAPVPSQFIIFSFSLYNVVMGILAAVFYCTIGAFLSVQFATVNFPAFFVSFVLSSACFFGLGLIAVSSVITFKKGDPVTWITANLLWLLGGAYFPVAVFPEIFQKVALYLPSTYAFRALRLSLFKGESVVALQGELIALLCFAACFLGLGVFFLSRALRHARRKGTIVFY